MLIGNNLVFKQCMKYNILMNTQVRYESAFKQNSNENVKNYLNLIYKEISGPTGISLIQFCEYMNMSIFIGKQLFQIFDEDEDCFLNFSEFYGGLSRLYCQGYKEVSKIVFIFLDQHKKNLINLNQCTSILYYILKNMDLNLINEQTNNGNLFKSVEQFFEELISEIGEKQYITFSEFLYLNEKINSDLFFIVVSYFMSKKPFSENILTIFNNIEDNLKECLISIKNEPSSIIKKPSNKFKHFFKEKITNLFQDLTTIKELSFENENEEEYDEFLNEFNFQTQLDEEMKKTRSLIFNNKFSSKGEITELQPSNENSNENILQDPEETTYTDNNIKWSSNGKTLRKKLSGLSQISLTKNSPFDISIKNNLDILKIPEFDVNKKSKISNSPSEIYDYPIIYETFCYKYNNKKCKFEKYFLMLKQNEILFFKNSKTKLFKEKIKSISYIKNMSFISISFSPITHKSFKMNLYNFKFINKNGNEIQLFFESEEEVKQFEEKIKISQKLINFKNKYQKVKSLSKGKYGSVSININKETNEKVIVKTFDKKIFNLNQEKYQMYMNELEILKITKHKNICKMLESCEDLENFYFVMEFYENGDLGSRLTKYGSLLSEGQIFEISFPIAEGINYLHSLKIVHRDLKLENICFDKHNTPKIIDFGMSAIIGENEKLSESYGTLFYVSPEIIKKVSYGKETDIWSFGIIIYFLLYGDFPFSSDYNDSMTMKSIIDQDLILNNRMNRSINNLISRCLDRNVDSRISVSNIVTMECYKKYIFC